MTLMRDLPLILILMNLGITPKKAIQTLHILDYSSPTLASCSTLMANQHVISSNQHAGNNKTPDYENSRPYFVWVKDDSSITLTRDNQHVVRYNQHYVNQDTPDYEIFWPYFGWVIVDTVQKTMEQFTQWGVSIPNTFPMKRHLESSNPALNVPRRHEPVATDTVFSATPGVDMLLNKLKCLLVGIL